MSKVNVNAFLLAIKNKAKEIEDSNGKFADRPSFEEIFSKSLKQAMYKVNVDGEDSYELGSWTVLYVLTNADEAGYSVAETVDFLRALLD